MAGTVHGLVNKKFPRYSSAADENAIHIFACVAHFFDHLTTVGGGNIMTRVASNYGGGTGFDFPGGASPIGYNKVMGSWRMNTSTLRPGGGSAMGEVYIHLAAGPTAGTTGWDILGTGGDVTNDGEVMMAMAFREDGGNPSLVQNSGGTTPPSNDGLDKFPSSGPIWTAGASTVHVFPRANNPGGTYNGDKQMMATFSGATNNSAMNIVDAFFHGFADDDNWVFFITSYLGLATNSEPLKYQAICFGLGDLQPNCEGPGLDPYTSYWWMEYDMPFSRGSTYGDTAGAAANQGGLKTPRGQISDLLVSVFHTGLDQIRSPNPYSTGDLIFEEQAAYIYNSRAWLGYAHEPGGTDFWRFIYGVPNEAYDATNKRASFGSPTLLQEKITAPWPDSIGEVPGATRTYDGVAF